MCAIVTRNRYAVTGRGLELDRGTKFTVKPGPVKDGQLVLAQAGSRRIVARYFGFGSGWLIQPHRWIRISDPADVRIVGAVVC